MGLFTRKNDNHPLSDDIDKLLEKAEVKLNEKEDKSYEDEVKKWDERIKELGILEEEEGE
ncbi:MAG: hypothetical protein PHD70_00130 [Anaerostipes sp.]|jgi:hypothetical protein|nr:hypothetical protein [Anaerostipes sp.]MDD3744860.1 hypothetical protein [Anaerostipes sp.]